MNCAEPILHELPPIGSRFTVFNVLSRGIRVVLHNASASWQCRFACRRAGFLAGCLLLRSLQGQALRAQGGAWQQQLLLHHALQRGPRCMRSLIGLCIYKSQNERQCLLARIPHGAAVHSLVFRLISRSIYSAALLSNASVNASMHPAPVATAREVFM